MFRPPKSGVAQSSDRHLVNPLAFSGPELTRELIVDRPLLKVIYMSGYTEDTIVQHGVLLPGIAFLSKPFTAETLGRKIRSVLHQ